MEAKKKVEYYKIHKSIYDYKKERERELQNELVLLEKIMPIYSKEDIIQIKNGNMQPVLQFNSLTRPNSASHRVLMRDTDPLNNLKRRFYRNSNKPLGQKESKGGLSKLLDEDYYSKRKTTTIKELNKDLETQGLLSAQKKKKKQQIMERMRMKIGGDAAENSMFKSDIDLNEDDQVIMETEEED